MNARISGLTWALVLCPVFGWVAAVYAQRLAYRGLDVMETSILLSILPAAVASAGNALLGRELGAVLRAGVLAALVCYGGFLLFIAALLLTFHPQ